MTEVGEESFHLCPSPETPQTHSTCCVRPLETGERLGGLVDDERVDEGTDNSLIWLESAACNMRENIWK